LHEAADSRGDGKCRNHGGALTRASGYL